MYTGMQRICAIMSTLLLILFLGTVAHAADPKAAKQQHQVDKMELQISKDGKTIVDQSGREVARFVKGMQVQPMEGATQSLQGCLCCKPECIIYDNKGQCVQEINSCTWDFDCSCKK